MGEADGDHLYAVVLACSCLSIFGTTVMLLLFVAVERLRTFPARLTFYLGATNWVWFISILFGMLLDDDTGSVCKIAGPLNQVFALSSIFWTSCIALHMALIISRDMPPTKSVEKWYHLFVWGCPITLVAILLFTLRHGSLDYEHTKSYVCYVSESHQYLRLLTQSGPSLLGFVFNSVAYTWAACKARALVKSSVSGDETLAAHHRAMAARVSTSASMYIAVYLAAWAPAVAQDLLLMGGASIYDDDGIYWLVYVFQALFFSQGFLNAVVYISNKWHVFRAVYWSHRSSRRISDFGTALLAPDRGRSSMNRKDSVYDSEFYDGGGYEPPQAPRAEYGLSPRETRDSRSLPHALHASSSRRLTDSTRFAAHLRSTSAELSMRPSSDDLRFTDGSMPLSMPASGAAVTVLRSASPTWLGSRTSPDMQ